MNIADKLAQIATNTVPVCEAIDEVRKSLSGSVVMATDVCDVQHDIPVKLRSDTITDFSKGRTKNLFDISKVYLPSYSAAGIKNVVVNGDSFSFTTSLANYSANVNCDVYLEAGTYYISGSANTTSGKIGGMAVREKGNESNILLNLAGTGYNGKFTVSTAMTCEFLYYKPYSDAVGDVTTISNVQLELGSAKTDYVPYYKPIEVSRYGKNLFDISTIYNDSPGIKNLVIDEENDSFSFETAITNYSTGVTARVYLSEGTYFLMGTIHTTSGMKCGVYITKPDGSLFYNGAGTGFYPNPMKVAMPGVWQFTFYRPYSSPVGDVITYSNVQLEIGSVRTAYEPYVGQIAKANADGTVEGLTSISPNMTLMPMYDGVIVDTKYFPTGSEDMCEKSIELENAIKTAKDIIDL